MIAFKAKIKIVNHNYNPIETQFNIPTLENRRQLNDLIFLHKLLNGTTYLPEILGAINLRANSKNTRNKDLFRLDQSRTNSSLHSTVNRLQRLGNLASDRGIDFFFDEDSALRTLSKSQNLPLDLS